MTCTSIKREMDARFKAFNTKLMEQEEHMSRVVEKVELRLKSMIV